MPNVLLLIYEKQQKGKSSVNVGKSILLLTNKNRKQTETQVFCTKKTHDHALTESPKNRPTRKAVVASAWSQYHFGHLDHYEVFSVRNGRHLGFSLDGLEYSVTEIPGGPSEGIHSDSVGKEALSRRVQTSDHVRLKSMIPSVFH